MGNPIKDNYCDLGPEHNIIKESGDK